MVFDAGMAARYGNGRRLRAADVDAWMDAARPYLGGFVLDLGAGTGLFTRALGANVVACEPSAAMRAVCRAECPGNPVVGGAAEATPFRDSVFDAIWASQMVHHLTDLATLDDALFRSGVEALERDAERGRVPERVTEHLDLIVFGGR